ncbi:LbtU family siderophore porin [uncultured Desulfuromusa sp.]|uniref:LbtU family siderophore porin n=1 Tax=uncultured Desulfuromusa sp. TaxID=219183 RepID=UPI002AA733C5|nr:LbtU family siderophore porin [uncultured Desulfuromusa sp.]
MKMIAGLTLCGLILFPVFAFAEDGSLAGRVTALEEALSQGVVQQVQFSGAIEAEMGYSSGYDDVKESDVDLTTLELGVDVVLADYFSGFALMKWEEDGDEGVFLDEGGVVLGSVDGYGVAVTAGKLYVPFGVYETGMISDPLTLELGETREGAVVVDFGAGGFYGSAYTFNSAVSDDDEDDMIDAYGVSAGYLFESDEASIDLLLGWISNLTSSGGFSDYLEEGGVDVLDDYAAGATASVVARFNDFTFIGEYLSALDSNYLAAEDSEPAAWNLEIVYGFEIVGHGASVAAVYQGSDEAAILGLPEERIGAAFGFDITDDLGIAFEYVHDEDYDISDGGTDESADAVTCQLALEF